MSKYTNASIKELLTLLSHNQGLYKLSEIIKGNISLFFF